MGYWPRHPRKDLEALLAECDSRGWRIEKRRKYYQVYCPCGDHKTTVHITPSDVRYLKNKQMLIRRAPCMREE